MAASRNSPQADLLTRVAAFVAARVAPGERLCVGLSGGCDSITLLHLLAQLNQAGRLSAIHVHHGLSPNADQWAAFCSSFCAEIGVPLWVDRVSVNPRSGLGLEAAARDARYAAFARIPADCLLLAQHRGDQAETLLFNLLRGSGVVGAAGIPVERRFHHLRILRPLLDVSRAELEAYARAEGLRWVDDESNRDLAFSRNYLRHQTLAQLSERFPGAEKAFAQAAGHFGEAVELLDELAVEDWGRVAEGDAARLVGLRELSLSRLKNLLRYRLRVLGWRTPVATRLNEFARQILAAGPDRHPSLALPEGIMRCGRGRLRWLSVK